MTSVLLGSLWGFKEFLTVPYGLWNLHKQVLATSKISPSRKSYHHDQVVRRLQLQAAVSKTPHDYFTSKYHSPVSKTSSCESLNMRDFGKNQSITVSASQCKGILKPLSHIWLYNFLLVFVMWVAFHTISLIWYNLIGRWFSCQWIVSLPYHFMVIILQNSIVLVMELVNVIYLKKICDRIDGLKTNRAELSSRSALREEGNDIFNRSRESSVSGSSVNIHSAITPTPTFHATKTLMDRIYSIVFFIMYRFQWKLLSAFIPYFWINFVINSTSQAFIYACYAYEYQARQTSDVTVEMLLPQIVNNWPFFLGYGFPLGALVSVLPGIFGWGDLIIAFTYPVLVIGAFQVKWRSRMVDSSPSFSTSLLIMSMRPALLLTNWLIYLFGCVGFRLLSQNIGPARHNTPRKPKVNKTTHQKGSKKLL